MSGLPPTTPIIKQLNKNGTAVQMLIDMQFCLNQALPFILCCLLSAIRRQMK